MRDLGDGVLLHRAHVVDPGAAGGFREQGHELVRAVPDPAERPGFLPGPLDREQDVPLRLGSVQLVHPHAELRDDMSGSHIRAVDVMRPDDDEPVQDPGSLPGQGGQLGGDLAAAVGVPGVQRVRDDERDVFRRRPARGHLVRLRAGHQQQLAAAGDAARVQHVEDAAQGDVEDQARLGVERLGALDVRQVDDGPAALHGAQHRGGVPDVAADDLAAGQDALQPVAAPTGEVIQDGDLMAVPAQAADQGAADEPGSARHEVAHAGTSGQYVKGVPAPARAPGLGSGWAKGIRATRGPSRAGSVTPRRSGTG